MTHCAHPNNNTSTRGIHAHSHCLPTHCLTHEYDHSDTDTTGTLTISVGLRWMQWVICCIG